MGKRGTCSQKYADLWHMGTQGWNRKRVTCVRINLGIPTNCSKTIRRKSLNELLTTSSYFRVRAAFICYHILHNGTNIFSSYPSLNCFIKLQFSTRKPACYQLFKSVDSTLYLSLTRNYLIMHLMNWPLKLPLHFLLHTLCLNHLLERNLLYLFRIA